MNYNTPTQERQNEQIYRYSSSEDEISKSMASVKTSQSILQSKECKARQYINLMCYVLLQISNGQSTLDIDVK